MASIPKTCCGGGTIHIRTQPVGQVTKLHGYDCYIATPPEGTATKGIIIFIPDAFGWAFPNNRLLSDAYARAGFLTYLPELMDGKAIEASVMSKVAVLDTDPPFLTKVVNFAGFLWHMIPFVIACREAVCKPRGWEFF